MILFRVRKIDHGFQLSVAPSPYVDAHLYPVYREPCRQELIAAGVVLKELQEHLLEQFPIGSRLPDVDRVHEVAHAFVSVHGDDWGVEDYLPRIGEPPTLQRIEILV